MKTISERQGVRVLCVDDNRDLADSEADLLHLSGYDAKACYDGTSALNIAEQFEPCICLIDLNMPGMDGDELAECLRGQAGARPVVMAVVTGMITESSRERTRGFDMHLDKPVGPFELIDLVDELAEKCGSPRNEKSSR